MTHYILNGHKVEIIDINSNLAILKIDGDATLEQIDHGQGRMVITGTAWSEEQRQLITETFPNLECEPKCSPSGLPTWKFSGDN